METKNLATEGERRRVRAVVEALARTRQPGYSAAEVAHDARNMVTALELYCDLLAEPGVLPAESLHFAGELKLVASASRRLVEKLMLLDGRETSSLLEAVAPAAPVRALHANRYAQESFEHLPPEPIADFQREIEANRNLLDAMAGMTIAVTVKTEGGAHPVRLNAEDLTRVLVNLVKNAAESMRQAGRIEIALRERETGPNGAPELVLTVEDSGPGIREGLLERIFEAGFTTRAAAESGADGGWPAAHHGLGLSITRSILEAAGGRIHAENRNQGGARIVIELPVRPQ